MSDFLIYEICNDRLMGLKENRALDGYHFELIIDVQSLLELVPLFRRAVTELAYIQEAPTKELCQTSEGREIIAEAKKLLERIP